MVLHDGETFINKEAPAMLQGLDEQIKVIICTHVFSSVPYPYPYALCHCIRIYNDINIRMMLLRLVKLFYISDIRNRSGTDSPKDIPS